MTAATRPWCALVCFPGLIPALAGTLHLRRQDGEEAARVAMMLFLLGFLPPGFEIREMLPGALVFHGDDE